VLSARGSEFEHDVPFGVARQLFEPLLLRASPEERAQLLTGPAAAAEAIITGHDPVGALSAADAGYRMLRALYWLVVNASDGAPLVLAVDDLQWADRATLRLIAFLERRIEGVPVLILGAVRAGEPELGRPELEELLVGQRAPVVRPPALSPAATAMVVHERLGREPAPEFADACHRATGGNPYFLRELVDALRTAHVEPTAASVDLALDFGPPAIARSVMHRLARLPDACDRAARACAILEPAATRALVGAVSGLATADLQIALAHLAAGDLIHGGETLEFVHPLVRTAIHAAIAPSERQMLTAAAARELAMAGEVARAADHLLDVLPDGAPWALDALLQAATLASARGAPEATARLLTRALDEPSPSQRRAEVLRRLGAVQAQTGEPGALDTLRWALEAAETPEQQSAAAGELAAACLTYGLSVDAAGVLDTAIADLDDAHDDLRRGLDLQRITLSVLPAQHAPPDAVMKRVAARSRHEPDAAAVFGSYVAFQHVAAGDPVEEALGHIERALANGTPDGQLPAPWSAHLRAAMLLGFCGQPERAVGYFHDAEAVAQRRGAPFELSAVLGLRGSMHFLMGDMLAAETDARASLDLVPPDGPVPPTYLALLIDVLQFRGRAGEAVEALQRVGALDTTLEPGLTQSVIRASRGRLRVVIGEHRAGLDDLIAAGAEQDAAGIRNPALLPWTASAALGHLEIAERDEALALSAENLARAERFGVALTLGRALRVHGTVLGSIDGFGHLVRAVEVLDRSYARLELAAARISLGAAMHENGRTRESRPEIQAGIDLAEELGAEAVAAQGRGALVAAGGRPRRRAARGASALTPAERRVAGAVASGLSNRDAAQALFLTEKTVETHLLTVYRKLGISSRVQLPDALGSEATDSGVAAPV
jgi:DNA-binding CsgD family transcriptional regulator/tetratricopeptide (TPR) repeat protein